MSTFVCERCQVLENTAASLYWVRGDGPALCSQCDPKIGKWHGLFERQQFDPERHEMDGPYVKRGAAA